MSDENDFKLSRLKSKQPSPDQIYFEHIKGFTWSEFAPPVISTLWFWVWQQVDEAFVCWGIFCFKKQIK